MVRPTHRGLIERLGKYSKFANPGFHWIIPFIDKMYIVNITEQMVDAQPQEIITNDNLNASVDAQIYFRVIEGEENVKSSLYNVNNYRLQIVNLARTTLRNIIGTLTLRSAAGKVVKAENEKIAAIDYATAAETVADGVKRAKIKEAEGYKRAKVLHAEGEAEAIKLVNVAADEFFTGNAQLLRKLEAVENSLMSNAKIVVPSGSELINIISEMAGVLPVPIRKNTHENDKDHKKTTSQQ
nr:SPFH domain-containing protein [Candidatus Brachybacter algidus]